MIDIYGRPPRGEYGGTMTAWELAVELLEQVAFGEVERHTVESVVAAAREFDVRADVLACLVLGIRPTVGAVFAEDRELRDAIALVEDATGEALSVRVVN